jgi:hypothetical protein
MRLLLLMLGISAEHAPRPKISLVRDLQRGSGWRRHELRYQPLPDRIRRQGFKSAILTERAVAELARAAWRCSPQHWSEYAFLIHVNVY